MGLRHPPHLGDLELKARGRPGPGVEDLVQGADDWRSLGPAAAPLVRRVIAVDAQGRLVASTAQEGMVRVLKDAANKDAG